MSKLQNLIDELCPEGVEYKKLGEVFELRNGYTPSKNNASFWEGGTIPWFRMEDIRLQGARGPVMEADTDEEEGGDVFGKEKEE